MTLVRAILGTILAGLLMLAAGAFSPVHAAAPEWKPPLWATFTVGSRHHKRGYNEHNYGFGLEAGFAPRWRAVGGWYRNSFYRRSIYYGVGYCAAHYDVAGGHLCFDLNAWMVSGYEDKPLPVVFPALTYERGRFGINIGPILPTIVGLQLKCKLD